MKTEKEWFAIRADGGVDVGIGHIMRCLSIAEQAVEFELSAALFSKSMPSNLSEKLKILSAEFVALPVSKSDSTSEYAHSSWLRGDQLEDAYTTLKAIESLSKERGCGPKFILVDHYALGAPWEEELKKIAPIVVIDDLCDREHSCEFLLDQNYGKVKEDYAELVPSNCKLYLGPRYALLRKEFLTHALEPRCFELKDKMKLLITLGGIDKDNYTEKVLNFLSISSYRESLSITVISGSNNPNLEALKKNIAESSLDVRLVIDTQRMAKFMADSDLCIGAAGSSSWERCALGLPTLSLVIADNQKEISRMLALADACVDMESASALSFDKLENILKSFLSSPQKLKALSQNSQVLCDGRGTNRLLKNILRLIEC